MVKRAINQSLPNLVAENLGQIVTGSIEFGDFTLVVGAQASGKSLFLQMFKLLVDRHQIFEALKTQGYDWLGQMDNLLNLYFGESMSGIWRDETKLTFQGKTIRRKEMVERRGGKEKADREESMYYIPAQRVVTMTQGWPRNFQNYDIGDPYVLKAFSETLRLLMEKEFSGGQNGEDKIFPKPGKMSPHIRESIEKSIFHGASIELDKSGLKRRFLQRIGNHRLPFMTWSAGQKEFMPLLLSLYHLIPSGNKKKKDAIDWVVIEEPEMGLHPQAIQTVLLLALQLLERGYKVVISTHSPVLLEMSWAIQRIKESGGSPDLLFELFSMKKSDAIRDIFKAAINTKIFKTWHFQRDADGVGVRAKDISSLDPGSDDAAIANWGGLSEFSSRAVDIVSNLPHKDEK